MTSRDVVWKWIELMNRHEVDGLMALYDDEAEILQLALGTPLKGKDEIRRDFVAFFESVPDTFTKMENLLADGSWVALEWSGGGTFVGMGSPKVFTLRGCGFFLVVEGKIVVQRGYWDKQTWFSQVGLPCD